MEYMHLGHRIRPARKNKNLTRQQLTEQCMTKLATLLSEVKLLMAHKNN